jgi:2'-5' RNA ligase
MRTIRTFIAMELGQQVNRETIRLIERLRDPTDGIRWVPTDNLHLTLKFLGDVDNTEVPEVCQVVHRVCADCEPFELTVAGLGGFPSLDRARVIYTGISDPTGSLTHIATELDRQFAKLGFKPEARDYTPHLTLGRVKKGSRRVGEEVAERLQREQHVQIGTMIIDAVQVIASFLDKQGPTYQVMDTIEF